MRRREVLALLAGVTVLLPVDAGAQRSSKVYRVAMLHPSRPVADMTETSSFNYYRAFFEELRRLGYVEGHNMVIDRYSGGGHVENYAELARAAVARNPDLLFGLTLWIVRPLKAATSTIPIVALPVIPRRSRPGNELGAARRESHRRERRSGIGDLGKAFSTIPRGCSDNIEGRNSCAGTESRTRRITSDRQAGRNSDGRPHAS